VKKIKQINAVLTLLSFGLWMGLCAGVSAQTPKTGASKANLSDFSEVKLAQAKPSSAADDLDAFLMSRGLSSPSKSASRSAPAQTTAESEAQPPSPVDTKLFPEATQSEVVVHALGFLGVPYKRGGNSPESGGLDCSGFVKAVYAQVLSISLPRTSAEQAKKTTQVSHHELRPGDLVFFNTLRRAFSHVGIYVGEGKFVHSPKPGAEVRVEDMQVRYWKTRFNGARRVT
jgi:cell wall-associated NlpC family hydrolase